MSRRRNDLSTVELEALKVALADPTFSVKETAERFGLDRRYVYKLVDVSQIRIRNKRLKPSEVESAGVLLGDLRQRVQDVAAELGITRATLYRRVDVLGIRAGIGKGRGTRKGFSIGRGDGGKNTRQSR